MNMKQTPVTLITWLAYIIEWRKLNKQKIITKHDLFAHDTKFVLFLRALFMYNERENGSTCVWLDTPRPEPITAAEAREFVLPLYDLTDDDLHDLCRLAGIEVKDVYRILVNIKTE